MCVYVYVCMVSMGVCVCVGVCACGCVYVLCVVFHSTPLSPCPFRQKKKKKSSKILQIKCAQIVPTKMYACGFTTRFSRVVAIRYDKNWYLIEKKTTHTLSLLSFFFLIFVFF